MKKEIGLYIHIPFCERKCPYCDFYSVTALELREAYTEAVIKAVATLHERADTVYFGGGTPSLMSAEQLYRILAAADIDCNAEITMECNPNSADAEYLREIHGAGINRLSFGIQSLNDNELSALGRLHDADEAVNAIKNAHTAGFENISADIMLATPLQNEKTLAKTIDGLCSLPVTHISAYMLKIEPDTPFGKNPVLSENIPDDDASADLYLSTVERLERHGFMQYEISNFALDGFESRHNLKYWHCDEYCGIGPSAHSYIDGIRKAYGRSIDDFIASPLKCDIVTDENGGSAEERIMLAMRLTREGIDISESFAPDKLLSAAKPMLAAGLLKSDGSRIMLTPKGCLVSNEIICRLIMS